MASISKPDLLNDRKNRTINSTAGFDASAYKANMKIERKEELISQGFEIVDIDVSLIDRDENQPRPLHEVLDGIEEFIEQLARDNFRLYVFPRYHKKDDGRYMIITGERRTTAFKMAGRKTIQAAVKKYTEKELSERLIEQFIENDQDLKKPLTIFSDAAFWRRFIDDLHGGDVYAAASARGKAAATIYRKLKLLILPRELQEKIIGYKLDIPKVANEICSFHDNYNGAYTDELIEYLYKVGATSYSIDKFIQSFIEGIERSVDEGSRTPAQDVLESVGASIPMVDASIFGNTDKPKKSKSNMASNSLKQGHSPFSKPELLDALFTCFDSGRKLVKGAASEGVDDEVLMLESIEAKAKMILSIVSEVRLATLKPSIDE